MNKDLTPLLNPNHKSFFKSTDRTLIFWGGAGAGKSYSAADKLLLQPIIQKKPIKSLVIRKSLPSLKRTCLEILQRRAEVLSIPAELNKNEMTLTLPYGSQVQLLSVNNTSEIEKIKSITDADNAWLEEANELTEDVYDQVQLRLRGGSLPWKQCIMTLNPISTMSWINRRFFSGKEEAAKIHTTHKENPWIDPQYALRLEALKDLNENLYNVYALGQWGSLEGTILKNWDLVDLPQGIKETIIGVDFGFNAPTAIVKLHYTDNPNEIAVEELLYESGLTNSELIQKLNSLNIKEHVLFCDSAEPARIQELRQAGYRVREADKDVKSGIQFLQNKKIHVVAGSDNLVKELQSYQWQRDKNGNYIDAPVKFRDHLIDAMRYAAYTNKKTFKFEGVQADGVKGSISSILNDLVWQQQLGVTNG